MTITRRDFLRLSAYGFGATFLAACGLAPNGQRIAPANLTPAVVSQALKELGFASFANQVQTHQDSQYLYVESNGMPAHQMMVGIQSWQQQVPAPQPYTGKNAWKIPLHPVIADQPVSAKTGLYRGAIALAVNGVPIFNALNNRGEDALLAGELDQWGGHAGRADDYHYHVAPLHLQAIVGLGNPIAYALDGFPIYGATEPDGATLASLDEFNGHFAADGSYHYHGTHKYPYINGGMRGLVAVQDDQIEPQPHTTPIRDFLQPLQGASVTDFQVLENNAYSLTYQQKGENYQIHYTITGNIYRFEFINPSGSKTTQTYTRREH